MHKRIEIDGFSERLEKAIWKSGLSLNEICRRAEIQRGRLWDYRFNGIIPNAGTIVGLCRALNVSSDWLLGIRQGIERREQIDEG